MINGRAVNQHFITPAVLPWVLLVRRRARVSSGKSDPLAIQGHLAIEGVQPL